MTNLSWSDAGDDPIAFECIRVNQPIGTFYIGAINALDVVDISAAEIRRYKAREVEINTGIQRELDPARVRDLRQYVQHVDAAFPTGIILSISSVHAFYDAETKQMLVTRRPDVASILDGQHRIAGLEGYTGPKFELNVVVFIDLDPEAQASLFSTINLMQTKVNRSLVADLYALARTRSPQKTAHGICRLLNSRADSPFYGRISILGYAVREKKETITQALFVKQVVDYISRNPAEDRDRLKRGFTISSPLGSDRERFIFRELFIQERDELIAKIIWDYFRAVVIKWPEAWDSLEEGRVLSRSTGFIALMRFLRPCYNRLKSNGDDSSVRSFTSILGPIDLTDDDFTTENYKPGNNGQATLFKDLMAKSNFKSTQAEQYQFEFGQDSPPTQGSADGPFDSR